MSNGGKMASGIAIGILIGAAIGAAVGLLYAPKSGKETRQMITDRAQSAVDKAKERMARMREAMKEQPSGTETMS